MYKLSSSLLFRSRFPPHPQLLQGALVATGHLALAYETIPVDPGFSILPDMAMDLTHTFLYVMSHRRISKVRVENCVQYTNCSGCLQTRDPYCGWCSLEKR
ncbi:unnamed protein product [Cyprideis torosa]|uniref:Uncharacterized protein n=1 Tax=Cyprideis torosa TaxID=163714 RepID=A0A7R8W8C4_9CRUS|nr:unnamed protein product [Cyprideis torosa]CAG0883072.1 unnamed protein product [Cyprideis torosa]